MRKMKTDSDIVEHLAIDKKPLQTKQEEPTITEVKLVPKPIVKNSCKFKREGWKTPCGSVYIELEYKGKRLLSVRCFPYRHVYPRENLSKAS